MKMHVIVPYFRSASWYRSCLSQLLARATDTIHVTTVNMDDGADCPILIPSYERTNMTFLRFDPKGMIGGHPLPFALALGMKQHRDADITVTVDTDALVLKQGWDDELRLLFADPDLVCAAINPRSDTAIFADCPEWNWMAFRTDFWHREVSTFLPSNDAGPDIGHLFKHAACRTGKKFKVWPMQSRPYPDKGATYVGDAPDDLWAMHAFYSSRKVQDKIPDEERSWILTHPQEAELREACRNYQAKGVPCLPKN